MDRSWEPLRGPSDRPALSGTQDSTSKVNDALDTLSSALGNLEQAVDYRLSLDGANGDLHSEINRLNDDRKHLVARLDQTEGRLRSQQKVTSEVSERLGQAMDVIRSVLEKKAD